jgi:hypothetical protein
MFVAAISIRREGYYASYVKPDLSKPFRCTVEVHGREGKVELDLSPDLSQRIVEVIADEVIKAATATAQAMAASFNPQPQIEAEATASE